MNEEKGILPRAEITGNESSAQSHPHRTDGKSGQMNESEAFVSFIQCQLVHFQSH